MKTRKEVIDYLDELEITNEEWKELSGTEKLVMEIQIETLEWVLT